ncbi:class I SAM-dependent methyltransferase [Alienimonas chondri]|uniref:Ubiquinone/menaquinone biosynthesis C-methyltransferase UbiE n=1 Tax=Alienimonas chondri TaxID=2681879 RepID=A0ABX1V7R6_9PLAN|nr:class I SAM-dependent methyltransferase [Alienimonas chondri]NNJ23992.1 Ubiquinone/menaquinone biosynthesis C-methyltransferase UbiE [Alienimonas chondri]
MERSEGQNRDLTRRLYDGPAGAVLALASAVSLHEPLIGQLLKAPPPGRGEERRPPRFDVTRFRDVLDVGSGAGQILGHLIREASPDARLTAFDLSKQMLRRSRRRMEARSVRHGHEPGYVAGDMLRMPFVDGAFDCVTAGWVLEHLPDPAPGLEEMARVLRPGGRLLLLCTADNVTGQWNSRTWKCRTYNPDELAAACAAAGLPWVRRHHLSPVHKALKFGGIIVECERVADEPSPPQPR